MKTGIIRMKTGGCDGEETGEEVAFWHIIHLLFSFLRKHN